MARPIWKGQIAFGLVHIPISIFSAERRGDIGFKLIDSRNSARVRYERINEETGKEVPWDAIVKGYEYDEGSYVLLTEKDLEKVSVEMTRTVEIEQFVDLQEIESVYFDRPYYIVPGKGAEKGYMILRNALERSGKVGIATVVIRTRQYLSAVMPDGRALVLNLLRFPQEVVPATEFDFPGQDLKKYKVTEKELELAGELIDGMTEPWRPEKYHDEYRDALMKLIDHRIASGKTKVEEAPMEEEEIPAKSKTINFMDVLKQSLKKTASSSSRKKASARKPASHKKKKVS